MLPAVPTPALAPTQSRASSIPGLTSSSPEKFFPWSFFYLHHGGLSGEEKASLLFKIQGEKILEINKE